MFPKMELSSNNIGKFVIFHKRTCKAWKTNKINLLRRNIFHFLLHNIKNGYPYLKILLCLRYKFLKRILNHLRYISLYYFCFTGKFPVLYWNNGRSEIYKNFISFLPARHISKLRQFRQNLRYFSNMNVIKFRMDKKEFKVHTCKKIWLKGNLHQQNIWWDWLSWKVTFPRN